MHIVTHCVNYGDNVFIVPVSLNPNCLHATLASLVDQKSSQTVPQSLLLQISTRPSRLFAPSLSLMSPCVQAASVKLINVWRTMSSFPHTCINRLTSHTSILRVTTVVHTNSIIGTVPESWLCSSACHIVQEDGTSALPKACTTNSNSSCTITAWIIKHIKTNNLSTSTRY